jgi:hypothetical protein
VPGSVLGVAVLEILPEFGREWENYRLAGYGIMLVLLIVFAPRGLAGLLSNLAYLVQSRLRPGAARAIRERSSDAQL